MKTALLFGAAGFVGSYLSKELIAHGYTVHGSDIVDNSFQEIPYTKANLLNETQVASVVQAVKPNVIINLAAISNVGQSWRMPQKTMQVNVVGALNILEAARSIKPFPKVLFIGSSEEYEASDHPIDEKTPLNANNPYGISKMTQEKFAGIYRNQYGMKVYCVRAFNHTGIGQKDTFVIPSWCKQAAQISCSGKPGLMQVGNLQVKRDFSHVKDIVRAYRMIIESDDCNTIYNVGSGQAIALKDMLTFIVSLSEQPIRVETDQKLIRPADTPSICCDHSLITEKLGWMPEYNVFDIAKELVEFYKQVECGEI